MNGPAEPGAAGPAGVRSQTAAEALAEDRAARRLAQTDFGRPLVLEAGAGTGKTTTLVARVLAWALGPGWKRADTWVSERWRGQGRRGQPLATDVAARVLERVVAITFTEAAAAEMAARMGGELAALAHPGTDPPGWLVADLPEPGERARRAAALLATLDRLVVHTIHAFCRGLLAAHPLEAGLHPELQVDADGSRLEEVARETVEAGLREAYGSARADGLYVALAARGCGPQELVEALLVLGREGLPADALETDPLAGEQVAALRARVAGACRRLRHHLDPLAGSGTQLGAQVAAALDTLAARLAEPDAALPGLVELAREGFPSNLCGRLADWRRGRIKTRLESDAFAGREAEVGGAAAEVEALLGHLQRLDPELLDLARRALSPLHARVRDELTARGIVTFQDLLAETARLLSGHPEVARRERAGIDQLLVDELQDTDRLQCEIIRRLALDGPAAQRPGLFLVGDPKQSIYGWRSADLAAYDEFVAEVVAAGGERRPLVENFRSVPAILDEVTRAVEPVMCEERGLQPAFQALVACAEKASLPGFASAPTTSGERRAVRAAVEHWISWRPTETSGQDGGRAARSGPQASTLAATTLEAEAIARDVRDLHDREGVAWGEVAVLLRSTGDLDVYLDAFRRRGVPFAVARDTQYYRRREVIEAAALVRAVLDPGDHLAMLTVLRSPLAGVPDAALVPLWSHRLPDLLTELTGPRRSVLERIRHAVHAAAAEVPRDVPGIDRIGGWETALLAAVESLAVLRRSYRHDPADVFVETLRRVTLLEVTEAARFLGPYRLANLDRFFRRLVSALDDDGDAGAVLRALRRSVAEAREAEEGQPREVAAEAVRVMTIHQSKGLDFGHVYLPQLHKQTAGGDRGGGPPTEVAVTAGGLEYRLFGAPTLGFDRVERERLRVEAAERVRLLYVAMTRPKERLVLAGRWPDPVIAMEPARAATAVDLLASRRDLPETSFAGRWQTAQTAAGDDAGARFLDASGTLWRFPALARWPAGDEEDGEAPGLPTAAGMVRDAEQLRRRRAAATERARRPTAAAASAEAHRRLRELAADELARERQRRRGSTAADGAGSATDREVAMTAGTAIHRALEELDLAAEPVAELTRLRARLPTWVAAAGTPRLAEAARAEAEGLLDVLAAGELLARLRSLASHLVARELPVLLPPESLMPDSLAPGPTSPDGEAQADLPRPVGFVSGVIDLLYRDPATGERVVVDYKTDAVAGPDALAARAAAYAPQTAIYARAVRDALGVSATPRCELWFLRAGQVVELTPESEAGRRRGDDPSPPPRPAPGAISEAAPEPIQGTLFDL